MKKMMLFCCLITILVVSSLIVSAKDVANHTAPSVKVIQPSGNDVILYSGQTSTAALFTIDYGTWLLFSGIFASQSQINSAVYQDPWNWTTCYQGNGNDGTANVWCRRTS